MTQQEFRRKFDQRWSELDRDAMATKNSQGALFELMRLYDGFSPHERAMANDAIAHWVESMNDRKRFDGLALIDHFEIRAAMPQVRALEAELRNRTDHEAPYELAKVRRILRRLSSATWHNGG